MRQVEKYCRTGHATDDSITRRMHFECWLPKATNTLQNMYPIDFPRNSVLRTRLNVTFIRTLRLLLISEKRNKHFTLVLRYIYLMVLKWRQTVLRVKYEVRTEYLKIFPFTR